MRIKPLWDIQEITIEALKGINVPVSGDRVLKPRVHRYIGQSLSTSSAYMNTQCPDIFVSVSELKSQEQNMLTRESIPIEIWARVHNLRGIDAAIQNTVLIADKVDELIIDAKASYRNISWKCPALKFVRAVQYDSKNNVALYNLTYESISALNNRDRGY
jgi:hypothetical protein